MDLKLRMRRAQEIQRDRIEQHSIIQPTAPAYPPLKIEVPSQPELAACNWLHEQLLRVLDLSLIDAMEPDRGRQKISEACGRLFNEQSIPLSETSRRMVIRLVLDEIMGLSVLEPLLAEATISDILVNGSRKIYVEPFGKLELTPLHFRDDNHLLKIIDRIVSSVGRRIDESSPMVDARLKNGSRVNAIIPPLALDGPILSIRCFNSDRFDLDQLSAIDSINESIKKILQAAVKSRLNILISGGTGSGKTTLLNALSNHIPANERVITIEDSAELQLQQEHVIRLETRPPNIEGTGRVTQRDLVRNSLRMRPDRIVVGEVRGEEAFDMLQAMNTGHDGSLTTIHANSARDALTRVENMVSLAGFDLPARAIRKQIMSAIHMVIQLERMEDGKRRLISIQEIEGMEGDTIAMSEIFRFERQGISETGVVLGHFAASGVVPKFVQHCEKRGIKLDRGLFYTEM